MDSITLIALNTKWYRYQNGWTQEKFAEILGLKMAYVSTIETGNTNMTCKNIDAIVRALNIKHEQLFNEKTALKAKELPNRIDMYHR